MLVRTPAAQGISGPIYQKPKRRIFQENKQNEAVGFTPITKRLRRYETSISRPHVLLSRLSNMSTTSSRSSVFSPSGSPTKSRTQSRSKYSSISSGYHTLKKPTLRIFKSKVNILFQKNLINRLKLVGSNEKYKFFRSLTNSCEKLPPRIFSRPLKSNDSFEQWQCFEDKEGHYHRDPNYFLHQRSLNPEMRRILIGWMHELTQAYKFDIETLFLAVDFLDRFLSTYNIIPINLFQTVGTTCMYIAAKLNEINPPDIEHFANVTDGATLVKDILFFEAFVLNKINWHLRTNTPLSWLKLFLKLYDQPLETNVDILSSLNFNSSSHSIGPRTRMRKTRDFLLSNSVDFQHYLDDPNEYSPFVSSLIAAISDHYSLRFSYPLIAACLLYNSSKVNVLNFTGYSSSDIESCCRWLNSNIILSASTSEASCSGQVLTDRTNLSDSACSQSCSKRSSVQMNIEDKENIQPF